MIDLNIKIHPISAFKDNYIWVIQKDNRSIVVDPGEAEPVINWLKDQKSNLEGILITHHHDDHTGGIKDLQSYCKCPIWGPKKEKISMCDYRLEQNDKIKIKEFGILLEILDVPGHTSGHIAYTGFIPGIGSVLFSGDTLFSAGCGRIFEGTIEQMFYSMKKLFSLSDKTKIFCGHEYTLSNLKWALTIEENNLFIQEAYQAAKIASEKKYPTLPSTIGHEKNINLFFRTESSDVIKATKKWTNKSLESSIEVFSALRNWKNDFKS